MIYTDEEIVMILRTISMALLKLHVSSINGRMTTDDADMLVDSAGLLRDIAREIEYGGE